MMLKVQRLYLAELLKVLFVVTLGISLVFSIITIVDKVDDFMPYKPPLKLLALYVLNSIPRYLLYTLPMATLLSTLFVFSMAIKRREIVAIKTAGGRMKRLLNPFVAVGVCLTFAGFVLGEYVVPATSKQLQTISNKIKKQGPKATFKEGSLYMRAKDGSIIRIGLHLPAKNLSKEVSIFRLSGADMKERIDAETARWEEGAWRLQNVTRYDAASGTVTQEKEFAFTAVESPRLFTEEQVKVEEMTFSELMRYQNRLAESGFRNVKLSVDLYGRLSYPLVNFFMLLLGISLAMGAEQRGLEHILKIRLHGGSHANVGVFSAGLGLIISVAYWLAYSFTLSLGYAGTLPPFVAPWIVPCIFSVLSLYLYHSIPE